jgi:hypothetical protein
MTIGNINRALALGCAVALAAAIATPASARKPLTDTERATNSYQTYERGQGGCVQDSGYGRITEGCD